MRVKIKYGTIKKFEIRKNQLEKAVLPLVIGAGIDVYCADDSSLWGVDKIRFGIKSMKKSNI